MPNVKSAVFRLSLIISSTFFSLLLMEGLLRVGFPIPYSMEVKYLPDGHLGTRLKPGMRYRLANGGTCTVNALGFRGLRTPKLPKPPDLIRIIALGGSSTFCYQTDDAAIWTHLLKIRLQEHYARPFEVLNAGVPGYSVFESKINYLYQLRMLDPDIVIVYHTWNDMKRFHLIDSGIYPKKGAWSGPGFPRSLLRNFQLGWRVRNFLNDVVYPLRRENVYGEMSSRTVKIQPGGAAHQWEQKNYEDLALLLKSDNVLPIFTSQATLISDVTIKQDETRAMIYSEYVGLSFEETLRQWNAITEIIAGVAETHDVPFIDVNERIAKSLRYFRDHVHLTPEGNKAVAKEMFEGMRGNPLVDEILKANPAVQWPRNEASGSPR